MIDRSVELNRFGYRVDGALQVLGGVVGEEDEEEGRAQQVQVAGLGRRRPRRRRGAASAGYQRGGLLLLLVEGHRELGSGGSVAVFHGGFGGRSWWWRGFGAKLREHSALLVIWGKGEGLVFLNLRSTRGVCDKLSGFRRIADSLGGLCENFSCFVSEEVRTAR